MMSSKPRNPVSKGQGAEGRDRQILELTSQPVWPNWCGPGLVKDPVSKKQDGEWPRKTLDADLWPLHLNSLAHVCPSTEYVHPTHQKKKPTKLCIYISTYLCT